MTRRLALLLALSLCGCHRKPPEQPFISVPTITINADSSAMCTSGGFYIPPQPKPWECFKVRSLTRVDDQHFEQVSENTCPYAIPEIRILIKFFNANWERIGVDQFSAEIVAPGERLRKVFPAPPGVYGFRHVGVRSIEVPTR